MSSNFLDLAQSKIIRSSLKQEEDNLRPILGTNFFILAIFSVVLWFGCFSSWLSYLTHDRIDPFTWLNCKFLNFFIPFSAQGSSCLLAVMCIEKFFALYFPLKTRSICTVVMAKRVTFVVTFVLVAYNMQNLFLWEADVYLNGFKLCTFVNKFHSYALIYVKIDNTLYSFAPFTVMVLTNGAIIYKFMRASCARDQGGTESTNQALAKTANKGTTMLITVSVAFLILTGPVAVTYFIALGPDLVLRAIIVLMRYTNHSINAVLYCVSGSRFRNELIKTFPFHLCTKRRVRLQADSNVVLNANTTL